MNLFVYGTLMFPSVMYAVTARKFRFIEAALRNWARYTVKGESYPGIISETSAVTEGIIYFDVDEWSLERLDEFEGDLYRRTSILAETKGGEIFNADTYAIKPEYRKFLSSRQWKVKEFSQKHLKMFLDTYSGFHKKM